MITTCGVGLGSLFAHAALHSDAPAADYGATELAQLESLDELVPENLFSIEAIIFKRLDTSGTLLVQAQATGSDYAVTLDSREPLLLSNPRLLPAKVFDLSPAASTADNTLPLQPASVQECFGQDAEDSVEAQESATPEDALIAVYQRPPSSESAVSLLFSAKFAPVTGNDDQLGMFSADFMANQNQSIVISDQPSSLQPQFMPLPRNRTEITPSPYLTLIQGVTEFVEEMEYSAYRRQPQEQLALQNLVRRLTNSGEFEVLEQLAAAVPERGNPQPIYVNLNDGGCRAIWRSLWVDICTPKQHCGCNRHRLRHCRPPGYAVLDQSQRMRSGELHYFDHPLFGMLVRIDKVSPPAELQANFAPSVGSRDTGT